MHYGVDMAVLAVYGYVVLSGIATYFVHEFNKMYWQEWKSKPHRFHWIP